MKQCRMDCIHIDACRRFADNSTYWNSGDCPIYKSAADVAPKSEVERLQAEVDRLLELVGTIPPDRVEFVSRIEINAIKENLAREIFEEIDKTVFADMDFFKELKKKYTEGKE